jgi:regulator of PEP synthase PpsR (kinase-PPPase family)
MKIWFRTRSCHVLASVLAQFVAVVLLIVLVSNGSTAKVTAFHHPIPRPNIRRDDNTINSVIRENDLNLGNHRFRLSPSQRFCSTPFCIMASTPVTIPEWDDNELSDTDEEMIRLIRGPLGASTPRPRPKVVVILSDTTGVTAKSAVEKSLAQFNGCDERYVVTYMSEIDHDDDDEDDEDCENLTTQIYPFVKTENEIASIVRRVGERKHAIVVYTLSDPTLREHTSRMCQLENLPHVDLLGPMYDTMSIFFNRKPFGTDAYKRTFDAVQLDTKQPLRRYLSDDYYRRIEAVEFTLKCDDGMNTIELPNADVVVCGVSRTGKTPLSVVLAQTMGLKVANVPLVVDLPPPPFLLNPQKVNPKRVFVLTLNPDDLLKIRKTRIERELQNRLDQKSTYADRKYILSDLKHAKQLTVEYGFTEIDVTGRAVEETASLIRSMLYDRFGDL